MKFSAFSAAIPKIILLLLALCPCGFSSNAFAQRFPGYGQPFTANFAPDAAGMWKLEFNTVAGMNYTIEESGDMVNWTRKAGGFYYGDGSIKSESIIQGSIPPEAGGPGGEVNPGPGKSFRSITFQITLPSIAQDDRMLVRRVSSSGAGGVTYAAWDRVLYGVPMPRPVGGYRNCYFMDFQDAANIVWVNAEVTVSSAALTETLNAAPLETAELGIFNSILPQLTAQLLSPVPPQQPDPSPSARRFLRVRREEIDSNGSGIPDWYELLNGFTNPFAPASFSEEAEYDADGDGLTNREEYLLGTSAVNADSDGDGALDGQEAAAGTDAMSSAAHPPVMRWIHQKIRYSEVTPPVTAADIHYELENSWIKPPDTSVDIVPQKNTAAIGLTELKARFTDQELHPFPALMPAGAFKNTHLSALSNSANSSVVIPSNQILTPTRTGLSASGYRYRVWMEQKPAPAQTVSKVFVRAQSTVITRLDTAEGASDPSTVLSETETGQPVIFTIPAGQTTSAFIDLDPGWVEMTRATLGAPKVSITQDVTVNLNAVEVVVPKLSSDGKILSPRQVSATPFLKVAKLVPVETTGSTTPFIVPLEAFNAATMPAADMLNPGNDPDCFYIRIRDAAKSGQSPRVRVITQCTETGFTAYSDSAATGDANVIELEEVPGSPGLLQSPAMILVSDDRDDDHPIDGVADDALNDRSRKIALGGKVHIDLLS